jgi:hypothetical protein
MTGMRMASGASPVGGMELAGVSPMRLLRFLLCALSITWSVGCGTCDCSPSGSSFDVSASTRGHIAAVTLGGGACDGVTPECYDEIYVTTSISMCAIIEIHVHRAGACHTRVDFDDGTRFDEDFSFTEDHGCCGGFYLRDAPDSTQITMTSAADAGAD